MYLLSTADVQNSGSLRPPKTDTLKLCTGWRKYAAIMNVKRLNAGTRMRRFADISRLRKRWRLGAKVLEEGYMWAYLAYLCGGTENLGNKPNRSDYNFSDWDSYYRERAEDAEAEAQKMFTDIQRRRHNANSKEQDK